MGLNTFTIHGGYYPALTEDVTQRFKFSKRREGIRVAGITSGAYEGLKTTGESETARNTLGMTSLFGKYTLTKKGFGMIDIPKYYFGAQIPIAEGVTLAHLSAVRDLLGKGHAQPYRKTRLTDVQKLHDPLEKFHGKANKFMLRGNYVWYSARATTGEAMASLLQDPKYSNFNFTEAETQYKNFESQINPETIETWAKEMFPASFSKSGKVPISHAMIDQARKDAAEEMISPGMTEPDKAEGSARRADIKTTINGKKVLLESTEMGGLKDHHELPEDNTSGIKYGEFDSINDKNHAEVEKKFQNYMSGTVLKDLNVYIKEIKKRQVHGRKPVAGLKHKIKGGDSNPKSSGAIHADALIHTKSAASKLILKNMTSGQKRFVNHTLGNMANAVGRTYRSGIPLSKRDNKTGNRWYGSTPIHNFPKGHKEAYLYDLKLAKKAVVIAGYSHLAALQIDASKSNKALSKERYISNHQTFGIHQTHNNRGSTIMNNLAIAATEISSENVASKPFVVSYSVKAVKGYINKVLDIIHNDIKKSIIAEGQGKRSSVLEKAKVKMGNSGLFWALPYIGLEESQYRGE